MLALSRTINPECEHLAGDMRTLRLGRTFDAVLLHDAVAYMTTEHDLRAALATAHAHLRPGGAAVFVPDYVRETFAEQTGHGGGDDTRRSLRYLEWVRDPDPADRTYVVDFALLLSEGGSVPEVVHERHVEGLFARDDWLAWLRDAGFDARAVTLLNEPENPDYTAFAGRRLPSGP